MCLKRQSDSWWAAALGEVPKGTSSRTELSLWMETSEGDWQKKAWYAEGMRSLSICPGLKEGLARHSVLAGQTLSYWTIAFPSVGMWWSHSELCDVMARRNNIARMQSTETGGFVLVWAWQLAFCFAAFFSLLASPHAWSTTRAFAIVVEISWSEWFTRGGMGNKESWSWVRSGWGTSEPILKWKQAPRAQ